MIDIEVATPDENSLVAERRQKLAAIRAKSIAYPNDFKYKELAQDLHKQYDTLTKEELASKNIKVTVAGRMMLKRVMGKASFATIQDGTAKIQLYISQDKLNLDICEDFKHWDIGDILGVEGVLFKTKTNELTIEVHLLRLLSKSLRPFPDKFHGLSDQEQIYRQRYLDLTMNAESKQRFIMRSKIIQSIRETLVAQRYLEVETPMMQPIPGGASAKPFTTHHNALDLQMYLRISPELYLKRLIVGGMDRIFEINRNFRNEGLSTRHNPEFTMMELYESFADYKRMMEITEELIRKAALASTGTLQVNYQGTIVDLAKPFERLTMVDATLKYHPEYTKAQLNDLNFVTQELARLTKEKTSETSLAVLQLMLFEETTERLLWQPTFIIDHPIETSPLARQSDTNPAITERFELFITGREIANAYSELNDPEDQAERFRKQAEQKDAGDEEAMFYDADYVKTLEYGMPPTGGLGIGIDRLVMLLTDAPSIRDVIFFPQMRPE